MSAAEGSVYMELFDKNGCLTDEGLQALQAGGLVYRAKKMLAAQLSAAGKEGI